MNGALNLSAGRVTGVVYTSGWPNGCSIVVDGDNPSYETRIAFTHADLEDLAYVVNRMLDKTASTRKCDNDS